MALDAFERRLLQLLPRLRRLARALTPQGADADDLVQTAIERGLARRAQWRPGTRLDAWMFTIMKNAWIDETRSRSRRERVAAPPEVAENAPDPLAPSLELRLEADAVRRAMAQLPEDQRLAVELHHLRGRPVAEVAREVDRSEGAAGALLARGLKKLRALLKDEE